MLFHKFEIERFNGLNDFTLCREDEGSSGLEGMCRSVGMRRKITIADGGGKKGYDYG